MFARSVYVSGFDGRLPDDKCGIYFTSLHIAEEFGRDFPGKVQKLLKALKDSGRKVIADISPRTLTALGYDDLITFIFETGIDYLRFDFGFAPEEIIRASGYCGVAINASTCDADFIRQLKGEVVAIHNFYPRPETGLDIGYFRKKNAMFRELGVKIAAFMTGDGYLRGPLHEGLPTLEYHRRLKPYVQYEMLKREVDFIIVADEGLSQYQSELIEKSESDGILRLPCTLDEKYSFLYDRKLTCRPDSPAWLCRVMESREYASAGEKVEAENCAERVFGSITIDNENYQRYSGEIQIMKINLPADSRVNVIGRIEPDYLPLLRYLERGAEFMLERKKAV